MQTLATILDLIPAPDEAAMVRARQHLDGLLKPVGSLGRLESLAVQLAGMPGLRGELRVDEKALIALCADHGVWHEGVTVSPKAVTAIQAANMVQANAGGQQYCVAGAVKVAGWRLTPYPAYANRMHAVL